MVLRPLFIITSTGFGPGLAPCIGYSLDPVYAGQCLQDGASINTVQVASAAIDLACEQGRRLSTVFVLRDEVQDEQDADQYSFSMLELSDTLARVAKYCDSVDVITEQLWGDSCNSQDRNWYNRVGRQV